MQYQNKIDIKNIINIFGRSIMNKKYYKIENLIFLKKNIKNNTIQIIYIHIYIYIYMSQTIKKSQCFMLQRQPI